ncbi:hypothetical protein MKX07_008130 [Trichoderma sp. CBMAI-0711]|nr:hypothetical protein MKX07_008130 [Trichoderma sp. CBMAI-0711]
MPVMMGDQSANRGMPSMLPSPPISTAWGTSGGNIWAAAPLGGLHSVSMAEPSSQARYYVPAPLDEPQPAFAAAPVQPSQGGFYPPPQQPTHQHAVPMLSFREQAEPAQQAPVHVMMQRLSPTTTAAEIRIMLVFSKELLSVDLIGPDKSEAEPQCSALLGFRSMTGASEACNKLNGRPNPSGRGTMIVSIVSSPAYASPAYGSPTRASSAAPNGASNGFADFLRMNHEPQPPHSSGIVSPSANAGRFFPAAAPAPAPPGSAPGSAVSALAPGPNSATAAAAPHHQDFAAPNTQAGSRYKEIFNRQSSTGNYLPTEVPGRSGKHLINAEVGDEDDRELLRDSVAYGHRGTPVQQRDATITPPDSLSQAMASLSLDPNITLRPAAMPAYFAGLPSVVGANNIYLRLQQHIARQHHQLHQQQHHQSDKRSSRHSGRHQQTPYGGANYPPVNPADQNPPCNTLYVGNLPMDACEDELKVLFSLTKGYKRMCFRIKHNGPMCFVEYEDIAHATKALTTLYGFPLHNSVKGGIRLSFSKNPLGVRSASSQPAPGNLYSSGGMRTPTGNGFAAASGPPPGLPRPPGLSSRSQSTFSAGSRASSAMGPVLNGNAHGNRNSSVNGQTNGTVSGGVSEAGSGYSQRAPYYRTGMNGINGMNNMSTMTGMNNMNNLNGMNGVA